MPQVFLEGAPLSIFPCSLDKKPLCRHGYKDAAVVWNRWSGDLIGVATGAISGIDIVDVDPRNGGDVWLRENAQRLPPTRVHRTRSRGIHLVYKHAIGNRKRIIAPGIDLLANGAHAIWWPAHGYAVEVLGPVAPFPLWLIDDGTGAQMGVTARPEADSAVTPILPISSSAHRRQRVHSPFEPTINLPRRTEHILRVVETAQPGTRNARLFWAACRFGEIIAEGRLRPAVAEAVLHGYAA
jgi:hypothetical protein